MLLLLQGVEMEDDFDGELQDIDAPRQDGQDDVSEDQEGDDERIEQQMGQDLGDNQEVREGSGQSKLAAFACHDLT